MKIERLLNLDTLTEDQEHLFMNSGVNARFYSVYHGDPKKYWIGVRSFIIFQLIKLNHNVDLSITGIFQGAELAVNNQDSTEHLELIQSYYAQTFSEVFNQWLDRRGGTID